MARCCSRRCLRAFGSRPAAVVRVRGVVRVEAAATLKPGDCIVESPLGTVDLRVESQLKFVHQTLHPA